MVANYSSIVDATKTIKLIWSRIGRVGIGKLLCLKRSPKNENLDVASLKLGSQLRIIVPSAQVCNAHHGFARQAEPQWLGTMSGDLGKRYVQDCVPKEGLRGFKLPEELKDFPYCRHNQLKI